MTAHSFAYLAILGVAASIGTPSFAQIKQTHEIQTADVRKKPQKQMDADDDDSVTVVTPMTTTPIGPSKGNTATPPAVTARPIVPPAGPAPPVASTATNPDVLAAQALELISLGTKCPLPNEPTPAGNVHTVNHFGGDLKNFDLTEEEEHSYRDAPGPDGTTERYTAKWKDFEEVYVSKSGNEVWLVCGPEKCIRYVEHQRHGVLAGIVQDHVWNDEATFVKTCDRKTAENIATAATILVKLNGGKITKSKPGPDDD